MILKKRIGIAVVMCFSLFGLYAQDKDIDLTPKKRSNILVFTPSKLLGKGQWDIKWFNNIYTETKSTFTTGTQPRQNFFTSSFAVFTGISENKKWNIGILMEYRSNTINGKNPFSVFEFKNDAVNARSGLTSIAPAIKIAPFTAISNLSLETSFHFPIVEKETLNGVFLDQKGYTWQNRIFYDYSFSGDNFQLFFELNTEYHFGKKEDSFANDSFNIGPGVFLSYFPTNLLTLLILSQHSQRLDLGNNFTQDYTTLGGGMKYQLTDILNIELLYTNFFRGNDTGLGETYNLGLRALF